MERQERGQTWISALSPSTAPFLVLREKKKWQLVWQTGAVWSNSCVGVFSLLEKGHFQKGLSQHRQRKKTMKCTCKDGRTHGHCPFRGRRLRYSCSFYAVFFQIIFLCLMRVGDRISYRNEYMLGKSTSSLLESLLVAFLLYSLNWRSQVSFCLYLTYFCSYL